ncbi:MAG: EI24 domain-containing protein [Planctomycetota bacterium]
MSDGAPNRTNDFFSGALTFAEGARFLADRPVLLPFVLVPFCLTVIAFVVVLVLSWHFYSGWEADFFADKDAWYWVWTGAKYWARLVFAALYLGVTMLTFVAVGSMITAPFNDYLSQRVEAALLPAKDAVLSGLGQLASDVVRSLVQESLRLAISIGLLVATLVLLAIPLLGPFAYAAVSTYISIRYLAWDGLDYSMSRRRWGFRAKMDFLKANRASTVGYGAISFLLLMIPFTMLFVLPLNAIGGTVLFCRILKESPGPIRLATQ